MRQFRLLTSVTVSIISVEMSLGIVRDKENYVCFMVCKKKIISKWREQYFCIIYTYLISIPITKRST
jgi:hypothetical protein